MGNGETHGEETFGGETAGAAARRAAELRTQAGLAWARVRRAVPRTGPPEISIDSLMDAAVRVPNESYVAGIAASLVASAWLYAVGKRTASVYLGFIPPLVLILGMYARYLRLRQRR